MTERSEGRDRGFSRREGGREPARRFITHSPFFGRLGASGRLIRRPRAVAARHCRRQWRPSVGLTRGERGIDRESLECFSGKVGSRNSEEARPRKSGLRVAVN